MVDVIDYEGGARHASVVGRNAELAMLDALSAGGGAERALLMVGSPGIGKTTLLDAAVAAARARGQRVLAARPTGAEAELPFAGLIDLCDRIGSTELATLSAPQRAAVEAALLRSDPPSSPTGNTAIALGLVNVIRSLAAQDRVLIVVDDLQWLDQASADLLAFAALRLEEADVRFLLARRPARAGAFEQTLVRRGLQRLSLSGLSLGAVRRLLFERLDLTLSRHLLRRVVEVTAGNPLFALEVGRSLLELGTPTIADEIPLPDSIEALFGERVAGLPVPVRGVLLAVALGADPRIEEVAAVASADALEDAIDAGVVWADEHRVHASHPMLAAAARRHSRARERRQLHLALAGAARDERLGVLHLALAARHPDAKLAEQLAAGAEDARCRGARGQAVRLAGHALRLTPLDAADRPLRVLTLAERLDEAGELRQLTTLLEQELPSLPHGTLRARALLLLGDGAGVSSMEEQNRFLREALGECQADGNMRAHLLAKMASNQAAGAVERIGDARTLALRAVEDAAQPSVERYALCALAWTRALAGQPVDDLCRRSRVADDPSAYVSATAERVAGKRLMWRGEVAQARALFDSLSALADQRGEPTSYAMLRLHRCELALRVGEMDAASALLDEWLESSDFDTQFRPQYQRSRALLAAARGDPDVARRWADEAIERARAAECRWDELEGLRARGMAAQLEQRPGQAVEDLGWVWEYCEREGVRDPGAFPVAPDLVEALLELGEHAEAARVNGRLGRLAREQDHPWASTAEKRGRGLAMLISDPRDEAGATLTREAARNFERLGLGFESARCLLSLGRALRRAKRWRDARETLEAAAAGLAAMGADGWASRAEAELARVGARRRQSDGGELTPSERRVVDLAAAGVANKQIASTLYVTVNTVEVHLAHAYAKLGVHSRSQLAKALSARS